MYYKIFIILIACCSAYFCYGQSTYKQYAKPDENTVYITKYDSNPPPLNFRSFDLKDGLPRGEVNEFIQTDDGFVWFSMSELGLVRFDGYHFRVFNSFKEDTTSLPNEHITSMAKSHKNGLWLATTSGIVWFDLTTYKSKLIPLPAGMSSLYYRLFEDSHQRLWIYYSENLFLYEFSRNKFTELKSRGATDAFTGEKVNIDRATIFDINESENGDLFLLGNCLLKLNPKTFAFVYYKITNTHSPFFTFIIDQDKKNIWLSGFDGLLKFNYKSDSLTHYTFEKIKTQAAIENHSFVSQKNDSQLWLSNEHEIRIFNKNTAKVSVYKKADNENISVTEFNAKGINGIDWFWSYKIGFTGLFPYINRFFYYKFLPGNNRSLCQWHDVKNNIIWFGSEDRNNVAHAYKYDAASNKLHEIKLPVKGMGSPRFIIPFSKSSCLIAIAGVNPIARRGLTLGKLFLLNTTTSTITQITMPIDNHIGFTTDSLRYQNGFSDKAGDYWITTEGQGLIHYNHQTQQFFQYASDAKDSNTLSSNYLYSVACGANNTVWAGSMYDKDNVYNKSDNVLNQLDVTTGKVQRIPLFSKDDSVKPLCEDKKGNVWIDTPSGLVCYNRYSGKKYKVPNFKHIFNQACEDSKGNIILLARDGIWFYDPVKKTSRLFDEEDGIRLEYFEGDFLDKRISLFNDSIFISDSYRFPVSDLYPKKEVPPLHFTSIKIFGKEITNTKNVDALDTLILPHNENQLSFEFAAVSFLSPERNRYACMMKGVDKDWQQLGADNSITYANLAPDNYTFKIKTANLDGVWGKERILYIKIIPAFWQTAWFKVLIIFLIAGFFYWLYRNRLSKINLKNRLKNEQLEVQKKEAEFKRKLSEVELSALRSQMNPHFIFNCLNSIKLYTVQNDSFTASEYLTKFSRLIRLVLENSRKDKVELHSELESLRLYIEMEAMRFKEKLQYSITENIDTSYTEIPPLIIQPYVENAIWHGLMHKESGGNLNIVVDKGDTDDYLKITITDDGIGRTKAAELKSKSAVKQKSYGMKVTSERIAIINQLFNTNTTVQIIDLMHNNGEAAGTQVIIQIPI